MSELRVLHQHMREVLADVQAKRKEASDSSWILREQEAMLQAVNLERVRRQRAPITMETLIRREQLAVGHTDYSIKFALYCAELVLDLPARP